ncbi:cobalamin biosynthesis protein [Streptomyces sp. NPDC056061]|uniref:cobalamin biosynthesis protein n=1 Tax=Streptomyces sp. NPDC056061 TaxID=3345700 RepID=UPI0035DFE66F
MSEAIGAAMASWPGPRTPYLPLEGDVAGVWRAVRDGERVELRADPAWPLPPGVTPGARGAAVLRVTDRVVPLGERTAVVRPASLTVGVGASRGVPADEIVGLVRHTVREAGLSHLSVAELATLDTKADEPGVAAAAARLGVPLRSYPAGELARVEVPSPSGTALAAVGTPSVAEAAALAAGGELLVRKRKSAPEGRAAMATCAVVRRAGGSGPDRCVKPGARRIVVLPCFLLSGVLPDRCRHRAAVRAAVRPEPDIRPTEVVGAAGKLYGLVMKRHREADEGDLRMNCDSCVHRIALPGFEDTVGLPRAAAPAPR